METAKQTLFKKAKKIVIKIGTQVLTNKEGSLDYDRIANLVKQVEYLSRKHKKQIIIITSGAIGAGMGKLGILKKPKSLPDIQALAAIGQSILIEAYRREFNKYGLETGQLLLTKDDFQHKNRFQNITNTISALLKRSIIPIINENDTVATFEITFGDNDQLLTLISYAIHADLVIILSNNDGLLDTENNNTLIPYVAKIDSKILAKVTDSKSQRGAGGMASKISAIKQLVESGEPVILLNGKQNDILIDAIEGGNFGTLFQSRVEKLKRKKRWIAYSAKTYGEIYIDEGAKKAVLNNHSLLAIGIKNITGSFLNGVIVRIMCQDEEIGRGLVNYDSSDLLKIKGLKSQDFLKALENFSHEEVIHKDNLVITLNK